MGLDIMEIKENLYDLYSVYSQYKDLHKYYMERKRLKGEEEIRDRIQYITKNKLKQRDEITTLLWVLGEKDEDENQKGN